MNIGGRRYDPPCKALAARLIRRARHKQGGIGVNVWVKSMQCYACMGLVEAHHLANT